LLHEAAINQRLVERDPLDRDGSDWFNHKIVETPTPTQVGKVIRLNGVVHSLVGKDENDIMRQETELYRAVLAQPAAATTQEQEQPRNAQGQFITHDPEAVALAPTVAAALEAQGISVDDLREFSQAKRGEAMKQSWERASEEFQRTPDCADWTGGENFKILSGVIAGRPEWMDKPSAETIAAAWRHMKEHNLVVENKETTLANRINAATSADELRNIIGYRDPSSSMWGR
jgi:hypothetical protein